MPKTIGSFIDLKKEVPEMTESRAKAMQSYLKTGIVKVQGKRLVYPTTQRLEKQIGEKRKRIDYLDEQIKEWGHRQKNMDTDKVSDSMKRALSPLYWEHQLKLMTDGEYREVYELVKPPMHLINHKKWNKRLSIFVKSEEYRLRLKESRLSSIGKKREKMSEEVQQRMEFNRQLAAMNKEKIEKQKKELEFQVRAMREVMRWAKDSGV
ncbi:hypothetical protein K8R43_05770 [archaeon]|nr:hypothetical protein [archaeon]